MTKQKQPGARAEELAAKALGNAVWSVDGPNFRQQVIDALREYGAAVRKRDAELCRAEIAPGASKSEFEAGSNTGCHLCAAAIDREPLP